MTSHDKSVPAASVQYMRRVVAAAYIQATYGFTCSPQWLAKLAVVGGGPVYCKAGRTPLYRREDLDTWACNRITGPRRSTSDQSDLALAAPDA